MNIIAQRLNKLRHLMAKLGLDYYLVVTDDFHCSEYVGDHFRCRQYMSGFTGSAGTLLISKDSALLWTDGRYFIQAAHQLKGSGISLQKIGEPGVLPIHEFLAREMDFAQMIGFDGRTVNYRLCERLHAALDPKIITFVTDIDLVGEIWEDRPEITHNPIWLLTDEQAGVSRREKLALVRAGMKHDILITSLSDIAWLYNFRGSDIAYTPVAMAYTIITPDKAFLYIAADAVSDADAAVLLSDGIELRPYDSVYDDVLAIYGNYLSEPLTVDKDSVNERLVNSLHHAIFETNPTYHAKAVKNPVEIAGSRKAHLKDAVAMTKAICWLKKCAADMTIKKLTEMDVASKILELRKQQEGFISLSFESIVATGDHGAIIHYAPSAETDKFIEDGFLLMDTGAHYMQGTTDITRTVSIGIPTQMEKTCYTAVLRGNIALGSAVFPEGTTGNSLDVLAREPLWQLGLDFNHGTGHGVGHILSVHEGPNAIRKSGTGTPFEDGMITSDEPGVYIEGQFGIRLENLILCRKLPDEYHGRTFMEFETLTLVPFDRESIMPNMMSPVELDILNEYHKRVYDELSPYMTDDENEWLFEATAPIYYE